MNLNGGLCGWSSRSWTAPRSGGSPLHPIEGGGRFIDCGIEARGGLRAGLDLARVCLADLADVTIVPGEVGGRPCPPCPGRHRSPGRRPAWPASTPAGRSGGEVLRDGLGPDAGRRPARADLRDDRLSARRPRRSSACSRRASRRRPRWSPRSPRPAGVAPVGRHAAGRADGQPGGGRPGRGAFGRDGLAQAGRARVRPRRDRLGARHGPPAPGRRATTWPRSAGPTTRSSTGPGSCSASPATTTASRTSGPRSRRPASRDYGEPFAAIFARYNHDFYAVDPHLFSPAEVVFQNIETGRRPRLREASPAACCSARSSASDYSPTRPGRLRHAPYPIRRPGLRLRLARPGPAPGGRASSASRSTPVPFPSVVGRVGGRRPDRGGRDRPDRGRRRARADDAAGEPGAGRLPDGRPAPAAAVGRPGAQPAPGGRGGRRQVPGAGPARTRRAAGPADLGGESAGEALEAFEALGGRRRGQAAVRLGRAGAGPRSPTASWPGGRSRRSSGSGPSSTSSRRSGIPATTSAAFVLRRPRPGGDPPVAPRRANGGPTWRWAAGPSRAGSTPRPSAWPSRRPRAVGAGWRASTSCPDLDRGEPGRPRGQRRARLAGPGAGDRRRRRRGDPGRTSGSDRRCAPDLSRDSSPQVACLLEATARKPGNVHRGPRLRRRHYLDFLLSAAAIAGPLDRARSEGVGVAVLAAVEATRRVVATNTNLGMILLLAPLAAVPDGDAPAGGRRRVLAAHHGRRRRRVYRGDPPCAPRRARGRPTEQDVADEPTVTLLEAMRLAADRDVVARQYANGLRRGLRHRRCRVLRSGSRRPAARDGDRRGAIWPSGGQPDTLIARKRGAGRGPGGVARAAGAGRRLARRGRSLGSCDEFDDWLGGRGPRPEPRHDGRPGRGRFVRGPPRRRHSLTDRQGGLVRGRRPHAARSAPRPAVVRRPTRTAATPRLARASRFFPARDTPADGDLDLGGAVRTSRRTIASVPTPCPEPTLAVSRIRTRRRPTARAASIRRSGSSDRHGDPGGPERTAGPEIEPEHDRPGGAASEIFDQFGRPGERLRRGDDRRGTGPEQVTQPGRVAYPGHRPRRRASPPPAGGNRGPVSRRRSRRGRPRKIRGGEGVAKGQGEPERFVSLVEDATDTLVVFTATPPRVDGPPAPQVDHGEDANGPESGDEGTT